MDCLFGGLVASASTCNAHLLHNPIVEVEDDLAHASLYFTAHTTVSGRAFRVMGKFLDPYTRTQDEWKIAAVELRHYTPLAEGRVKTPMWRPA